MMLESWAFPVARLKAGVAAVVPSSRYHCGEGLRQISHCPFPKQRPVLVPASGGKLLVNVSRIKGQPCLVVLGGRSSLVENGLRHKLALLFLYSYKSVSLLRARLINAGRCTYSSVGHLVGFRSLG